MLGVSNRRLGRTRTMCSGRRRGYAARSATSPGREWGVPTHGVHLSCRGAPRRRWSWPKERARWPNRHRASCRQAQAQVPAATGGNGEVSYTTSGLQAGLRFDATGMDSPGCPRTEDREGCGIPTTAAAAHTVTITATDADSKTASSDWPGRAGPDRDPLRRLPGGGGRSAGGW